MHHSLGNVSQCKSASAVLRSPLHHTRWFSISGQSSISPSKGFPTSFADGLVCIWVLSIDQMWWMWCQASQGQSLPSSSRLPKEGGIWSNAKGIVIGRVPSAGSMKWENPPLGLFAIPPMVGLLSAAIGFKIAPLFGFEEKFLADIAPLLFSWFTLIILSSILMFTIPKEWGDLKEMRYGVMAGVIIVFLPQICGLGLLLCALWFIAVTLGWVFVSTYQWKYDVQPFKNRTLVGCRRFGWDVHGLMGNEHHSRLTQMFTASEKKLRLHRPPSRPTPLCLTPPNGTRKSRCNQQLTQTIPDSICSAKCDPASTS